MLCGVYLGVRVYLHQAMYVFHLVDDGAHAAKSYNNCILRILTSQTRHTSEYKPPILVLGKRQPGISGFQTNKNKEKNSEKGRR